MSFLVSPPDLSAYLPLAGGTMTGALAIASGTLTASAPALNITQTWNNAGVSFRAIDINITNTLSALSYPIVVSVNAANVFYVSSAGDLYANNFRTTSNNGSYGIGSDALVYRDAAATLAQRNGTHAQTFKVYGTTDAGLTNYERLAISAQQGVGFTIGAETLGTGADNLDITVSPAGTGSFKIIPPAALTASAPGLIISQTWNASGVTMNGAQINITRTASSTQSKMLTFNLNGVEVASVAYDGAIITPSLNVGITGVSYPVVINSTGNIGIGVSATGRFSWSSTTQGYDTADLAIMRNSAGVAEINNGTAATYRDLKLRNMITNPGTFAALVAAATAGKGARAFIIDGAANVYGAAAAGGGSLNVPVYSDGTNWIVG